MLPPDGSAHGLDLSWVTPQLAVGGHYPAAAAEHLGRALGVRHVVDLRVEACDDEVELRRHGLELLHLPTEDMRGVSLPMLDDGVAWVTPRLDRGDRVYVHCQHGIGRSALLALCVLVARGDDPLHALVRAKGARRKVSPSPDQLEAYRAWLARHRERTGARFEIPGFEALAHVAYSHLREPAEPAAG
jgi:protein-tyrosine phosphatase